MVRARAITREVAEQLAIQGLGFIAAEPDRLSRFLALSGVDPAEIRAAAADSNFLAGVLDHLMEDERLLMAFASEQSLDPGEIARARAALGGAPWERESP
jgi:hypothetical protein